MDADTFEEKLKEQFSHERIEEMVDARVPEYLDKDWEDDFEDEWEAYSETGHGEAEDDVVTQILVELLGANLERAEEDVDYEAIVREYDPMLSP